MRRTMNWMWVLGLSLAGATALVGLVRATPAGGFTSTTVSIGRIGSFEVFNNAPAERTERGKSQQKGWVSWQRTKGASDLYIQNNVWAPGGTTGWHSHPGHSLITVTAGTLTVYEGHDPSCKPRVYTTGMAFVDEGGDHVHVIRNEDSVEARTMAVQLLPAGAPRRIDVAGPATCPF